MAFQSQSLSAQGTQINISSTLGVTKPISAITKAAQAKITSTSHGLTVGTVVHLNGIVGMVELNGGNYVVVAVDDADTFTINADTTTATTYVSGGTAAPYTMVSMCEVTSFSGFDGEASELDATTLCSEEKEKRIGLRDNGSFSIDYNFVASDPAQKVLREAASTSAQKQFVVLLPADLTGARDFIFFSGYVKSATLSGGVDAILTASSSITITGKVEYVEVT